MRKWGQTHKPTNQQESKATGSSLKIVYNSAARPPSSSQCNDKENHKNCENANIGNVNKELRLKLGRREKKEPKPY